MFTLSVSGINRLVNLRVLAAGASLRMIANGLGRYFGARCSVGDIASAGCLSGDMAYGESEALENSPLNRDRGLGRKETNVSHAPLDCLVVAIGLYQEIAWMDWRLGK